MNDRPISELRYVTASDQDRRIKVAVAVRNRPPSEQALKRLRGLGLTVDRIVGNKILGSVLSSERNGLVADADILAVEEGAQLSLSHSLSPNPDT